MYVRRKRKFVKRKASCIGSTSWVADSIGGKVAEKMAKLSVGVALIVAVAVAVPVAFFVLRPYQAMLFHVDPELQETLMLGEPTYAYISMRAGTDIGLNPAKVWRFGDLVIEKVRLSSIDQLRNIMGRKGVISVYGEKEFRHAPLYWFDVSRYPFKKCDADNRLHEAYGAWCGRNVTVAIIDTGIDYTHPDFYDEHNRSIIKVLVSMLYVTPAGQNIIWIPHVNGTMDDLLDYDMQLWKQYGEPAFLDVNGHGCVTPDTIVWTTDSGPIRIEDLWKKYHYRAIDTSIEGIPARTKVMKKVVFTLGFDESSRIFTLTKILAIHRIWYNGSLIVVKLADGTMLKLTPWHPIYVVERVRDPYSGKISYRYVGAVRAEQLLAYKSRQQVKSHFILAPIPPRHFWMNAKAELVYFMGLVYGDGYVKKGTIDIYDTSLDAVKRYGDIAKSLGGDIRIWKSSNSNAYRLRVYMRGFEEIYREYVGNIREKILSDIDLARAFMAGLFDADGYVGTKDGVPEVKIVSKDREVLEDLRDFLRSIGIDARIRSGGTTRNGNTTMWHLVITKWANVERFYHLIKDYSVNPKVRKLEKILKEGANPTYTTKRVIDLGWARAVAVTDIKVEHYTGWLYDFTTETSNYVGNGFIVHNTHVAGIIAGRGWASNGAYVGIAPCTELVIIKAFNKNGEASLDVCLSAIEWVWNNTERYGIKILSLSWGAAFASDGNDPLSLAVDELVEKKGVWVFAAVGNEGNYPTTVVVPAVAKDAFAVGAWDPYYDKVAPFSSLGPTIDLRMKPDFMGAGVMIVSCKSAYADFPDEYEVGDYYVALSGTSMSTPAVAGVAADFIEYFRYWHHRDPAINDFLRYVEDNGRHIDFVKDFITGWGIPIAPHTG